MQLSITEEHAPEGYERLVRIEAAECGLRAFICIHSTVCGPAAGGCRMWPYATEEEARTDVLRLAEGMTYKNVMADLGLGGGKSVIIGDPRKDKSEALFRAFGRAVQSLGGLYYTAEDVGTSTEDVALIAQGTPFAVGLDDGEHGSGDPSPFTAEGVFQCLLVGAEHAFGSANLAGRIVLLQGLGHVGMALAGKLHTAGAKLIVSDLNAEALAEARTRFGAEICALDAIFEQQMDIFVPCALGGILTAETVGKLTARLICGAANNQLATAEVADLLRMREIRYLPDYVVNAGGIISVAGEIHRQGFGYREERLTGIASRIHDILRQSDDTGRSSIAIANEMAQKIIAARRADGKIAEEVTA